MSEISKEETNKETKTMVEENATDANESTISDDNTCVVCFKDVNIYSIGECDHPVCYECSTRMRVLCTQNECPICRFQLSKVIFTYEKLPYRELEAKNRSEYYSKKYKIGFYACEIQQAFYKLLDHPCPECNTPPYRTFQGLKNHVRKEHNLHYCDLCTENLKIFTFERRCYTQAELGLHRTKGDTDNRSHRGHPLCEYCNKRYLDRDELFRHLRREHYFCHFCDADGCNEFYKDYNALASHFRQDHFLCEEGKCASVEFIGAFRTEIDYKAHVSSVHGKLLNKQQSKQTRTLQLEITLGPRGRSGQNEQGIANVSTRGANEELYDDEEFESSSTSTFAPQLQQHRPITIDARNEQEFPTLAGKNSGPNLSLARPPPFQSMRNRTAGLARTKENFPALGVGGLNTPPILPTQKNSIPSSAAAISRQQSLAATNNNITSGVVIHVSNRSAQSQTNSGNKKSTEADFPALPSALNAPPIPPTHKNCISSSTGAISRQQSLAFTNNNSSSMVIHVSNRPTQSQSNHNCNKKSTAADFPSLPAGKNGKRYARPLDEDCLPAAPNSPVHMSNISAKHRNLVDDYVSVVHPCNFQKLQMIQNEEVTKKTSAQSNSPKLTVEDFPSLQRGDCKPNTSSNNWIKTKSERKQRELDNRKAKVAAAPLLNRDDKFTINNKIEATTNNNNTELSQKKDKKMKEKKSTAEIQNPKIGNGKTPKERSNNNNNESKLKTVESNSAVVLPDGNDEQTVRPPPGFINQTNQSVKPPPGFQPANVTINSLAKSPNNLTFTTSLGDSYSIVSTHSYTQPPEASARNKKLVQYFKDALQTPEALEEFRFISQKFREGVYKAPAYYEHCQAALKDKFDKIFPELLALLPDISKQQALYLEYTQHLNSLTTNHRKQLPKLEVCTNCKQVLLSTDSNNHRKMHTLSNDFPSLGSNNISGKTTTNRK